MPFAERREEDEDDDERKKRSTPLSLVRSHRFGTTTAKNTDFLIVRPSPRPRPSVPSCGGVRTKTASRSNVEQTWPLLARACAIYFRPRRVLACHRSLLQLLFCMQHMRLRLRRLQFNREVRVLKEETVRVRTVSVGRSAIRSIHRKSVRSAAPGGGGGVCRLRRAHVKRGQMLRRRRLSLFWTRTADPTRSLPLRRPTPLRRRRR